MISKQAEKFSVIQNPQKIARSLSIYRITPTIHRTDFAFENVVEPLRLYGDVARHQRDSKAAKPRSHRFVIAIMRRQKDSAIAHFFKHWRRTFINTKSPAIHAARVSCKITRQLFKRLKAKKQLAHMARQIKQKFIVIDRRGIGSRERRIGTVAGNSMRKCTGHMFRIRKNRFVLPAHKPKHHISTPRKNRRQHFTDKNHYYLKIRKKIPIKMPPAPVYFDKLRTGLGSEQESAMTFRRSFR